MGSSRWGHDGVTMGSRWGHDGVTVMSSALPYLQALGLLPDLHGMLLPQLLLPPLVVLHLVGELRLVLRADQLGPRALHQPQLAELHLLGGLVVPQQHGALQVLQRLLLVQVLGFKTEG